MFYNFIKNHCYEKVFIIAAHGFVFFLCIMLKFQTNAADR